MSTTLIRILSLSALITVGSQAWAAQEGEGLGKHRGNGELREKVMEKFDANHDGKLDESERAAAKAALKERMEKAKEHHGEFKAKLLERFDANHDGKLDDGERAAAKAALKERKEHRGDRPHKGDKN